MRWLKRSKSSRLAGSVRPRNSLWMRSNVALRLWNLRIDLTKIDAALNSLWHMLPASQQRDWIFSLLLYTTWNEARELKSDIICAYFYTPVLPYQFWHLFDLSCPLHCEGAATYTESVFLDGHSSTPTSTAAFYNVLLFIHPYCLLPHVLTSCRHCCWQTRHTPTLTRKPTNCPPRPWNPVECRASHEAKKKEKKSRTTADGPCGSVTDWVHQSVCVAEAGSLLHNYKVSESPWVMLMSTLDKHRHIRDRQ